MQTKYKNVVVFDMQIKKVLISRLRDKKTTHQQFVRTCNRLSRLLWEWALSMEVDVYTEETRQGMMSEYTHYDLPDDKFAIVSILRAADSIAHQGPLVEENNFMIGKILIQRDEKSKDKKPIFLYKKIPESIKDKIVFVVDNMIGTGQSAALCIDELLKMGCEQKNLRFINFFSCDIGLKHITEKFPDLKVYTVQIDPILNDNKYLVPGVGDMGDRYFHTEKMKNQIIIYIINSQNKQIKTQILFEQPQVYHNLHKKQSTILMIKFYTKVLFLFNIKLTSSKQVQQIHQSYKTQDQQSRTSPVHQDIQQLLRKL